MCDADEIAGCTDATACNYNASATDDDGNCVFASSDPTDCESCSGETDGTGVVLNNDADGDGVCDADEIAGCTDATACNYNASATDDDGNCIYANTASSYTVNAGMYFYDPSVLNISVGDTVVWMNVEGVHDVNGITNTLTGAPFNNPESFYGGPTGPGQIFFYIFNTVGTYNYDCSLGNHAANGMVGTIIVSLGCESCSGETDGTGVVLNNDVDGDGVCDADEIAGCTDATACNYNASATDTDNTLCEYPGCTDPAALNYDADASCDDGSCIPILIGCMDPSAVNYIAANTVADASCIYIGCTDPTADNYSFPNSGINGSCTGCYDGDGDGINGNVQDDGSCTYTIFGCTDATACNYNASATDDDGNCVFASSDPTDCESCSGETDGTGVVLNNDVDGDGVCDADEIAGCTDATSTNYDPNATDDDGSCISTPSCVQPGDANCDGFVNLADLTLVINNWLSSQPVGTNGDVVGSEDGFINLADLTLVINNWLQGTPPTQ